MGHRSARRRRTRCSDGRAGGSRGRRAGVGEATRVTLDRGTVVFVELDPTIGREQRGVRPCIAVSDPAVNADQRFPLIPVVPVTGAAGGGALRPALSPGQSGLTKASYGLVDHLRSIDKRRIRRIFGQVSANELASIDQGLQLFLGLSS